ncbi:MAG: hypothetical protein ABIT08_08535 [Bacteroidia bacterium]
MVNDTNLSLRTEILDMALHLENDISELILFYLNIENEDRKAINHKSGSLSFKNKIDLLFDLQILSKEENQQFLLMMEFRNQFMHNINCNSFIVASKLLDGNKLLEKHKGNDLTFEADLEFQYRHSYNNLFIKCLNIILQKRENRMELIKENANALRVPHENSIRVIDMLFDIYMKICEQYAPSPSDTKEIVELKSNLIGTITEEFEKLDSTEEFKFLASPVSDIINAEKINRFLKAV